MIRQPPRSTLVPYTTLVRSAVGDEKPAFSGELVREDGEEVETYEIQQGTLALKDGEDGFKASNYEIQFTKGEFIITKQSIVDGDVIKVDTPADVAYDGMSHQWEPAVTDKDGNALVEGTDYDVSYSTDDFTNVRAEVRRVGKECRYWRSQDPRT